MCKLALQALLLIGLQVA